MMMSFLNRYSTDVLFEPDNKNAKAQQDWMVHDLEQAQKKRSETPWIIAIGSQPMYCSFGALDEDDCSQNTSKVRRGYSVFTIILQISYMMDVVSHFFLLLPLFFVTIYYCDCALMCPINTYISYMIGSTVSTQQNKFIVVGSTHQHSKIKKEEMKHYKLNTSVVSTHQ